MSVGQMSVGQMCYDEKTGINVLILILREIWLIPLIYLMLIKEFLIMSVSPWILSMSDVWATIWLHHPFGLLLKNFLQP